MCHDCKRVLVRCQWSRLCITFVTFLLVLFNYNRMCDVRPLLCYAFVFRFACCCFVSSFYNLKADSQWKRANYLFLQSFVVNVSCSLMKRWQLVDVGMWTLLYNYH